HCYDPIDFLHRLQCKRISYIHIAGHYDEADDLKIDTHGAPVKDEVWSLLSEAYKTHGVRPTLLERDFNFPAFDELISEVSQIREHQVLHETSMVQHASA
ncbi:MAG: multinuclear nonheme iron-dependent oxidase, partial [Methylococcales bacterium]